MTYEIPVVGAELRLKELAAERMLRRYLSVKAISRTPDEYLIKEVVDSYEWLVLQTFKCLQRRWVKRADYKDDMMQVGRVALYKCLDNYDPEVNSNFAFLATVAIQRAMKLYLRVSVRLIKLPRRHVLAVEKLCIIARNRQLDIYNVEDHAKLSEVSGYDLDYIGQLANWSKLSDCPTYGDMVDQCFSASKTTFRDDAYHSKFLNNLGILQAIGVLEERKGFIVQQVDLLERTQDSVARDLNLSQMQVSRIRRQALSDLRRELSAPGGP